MNCKLDIVNCHLCADCKSAKVCKKLDLRKILLGVWFSNDTYIASTLPNKNPCIGCAAPCQKACISKHVYLKDLIKHLYQTKKTTLKTKHDLTKIKTKFFNKTMENPFMLSSSVVSSSYEKIARAFAFGWAGAVMKTITYINITEFSPRYDVIKDRIGTFTEFKNIEQLSQNTPEHDMDVIHKLKKNYPNKIVIASIMGRNEKEWAKLAKMAQSAGADAVELNFSCPNMEEKDTGSAIGQNPAAVYKFTKVVKKAIKIPVLAKLTPNVVNMYDAAKAAHDAKADGISAINTIKSIMTPRGKKCNAISCVGGLSGAGVKPIGLRFIAEIRGCKEFNKMYISAIGGIESPRDALDYLSLGANNLQITTAVMQYGYRIIEPLINGLLYYMECNHIKKVSDIEPLGIKNIKPLDCVERGYVIYPKFDRSKCIKCGRCYISCQDGGHAAIVRDANGWPVCDLKKCVGCHLCTFVCPQQAITTSKVKAKK